jgi:L-threonylcarbamoyladenylate synthase
VLSHQRGAEKGLPSPGLLAKHYAPKAKMILFRGRNAPQSLANHLKEAHSAGQKVGVLALEGNEADTLELAGAVVCRLGADLDSVARQVYAGMRLLDSLGVDLILCRDFGVSGLGLAIRDRLTRAAARVVNED